MLSVTQYTQAYISACRARFNEQLSAYQSLVEGSHAPNVTTFERKFCRTLLLSLDNSFVDRNPDVAESAALAEVRLLCDSMLRNNGRVLALRNVSPQPSAVLGLVPGQEIVLTADGLAALSEAFFDAVEHTYGKAA
jgi:hypothetical protein